MERFSKKQVIVAAAAGIAVILLLGCFGIYMLQKKDKSYRSIKIVEIEGNISVSRPGVSDLKPSVNMNLQSGDYLTTSADSYAVLLLDTDKYVMLGESGAMRVYSEGSRDAGRTSIKLESGSVLSDIQNPLNKDSSFEIVTPNATMSVRGTVFEVRKDKKDGDDVISVLVYDGSVAVGAEGAEPRLCNAGEFTEFTGENPPKFLADRAVITEKQMSKQVRERLQKIEKDGKKLNLGTVLPVSGTPSGSQEETKPSKPSDTEPTQPSMTQAPEETKPAPTYSHEEEIKPAPETTVAVSEETEPAPTPEETEPAPTPEESKPAPTPEETKPAPTPEETKPAPTPEETKPAPTPEETKPAPTPEETKPAPTPEESRPDTEDRHRVTFYRSYIALWNEEDGVIYSTIMDIDPYIYTETEVVNNMKIQDPGRLSVQMTPEGYIKEKEDLVFVSWCTSDGKEWNFETDVVAEDTALYPIWQDGGGRKYYPVFCKEGNHEYPCNNIIEGSVPRVPKNQD